MKYDVSISIMVGSPGTPSAKTAQSFPGPRRRAFSQPSPISRARLGRIRLAGEE